MADSTTMVIPPYSNIAPLYLIPTCILGVLCLVLVIARIYTRVTRTKQLYLDDKLMIVAEPLSLIGLCCAIAACAHGWGKPAAYFTPNNLKQTLKLQFANQVIWTINLCLVRLSVACALLRYRIDKLWRIPLYFMMTLQILVSCSYIIIAFGQCRPVSSNWEMVPDVKCWDIAPIITYGWVIAGVYVAMDLTLSLMPIVLIRTLNRSKAEKFFICVLMGLGLLATAVACAKMTTFNSFGKGDVMQATIKPSLYAKLEEQVGIIASSLPALKSPAEQYLKKFGLLKEHQLTRPSCVADVNLPTFKGTDERASADGSSAKDKVQFDSIAVPSGSTPPMSQEHNNKSWQAV